MRTEERMYRDLGTELHSFFKSAVDWFLLQTGKVLFVWLMMTERHKTVLHTESELRLFHNGRLYKFFILLASVQ